MVWIIIGLLLLVIAGLYFYIHLLKDELDHINIRLSFIANNETNSRIYLRYRLREMNELATNINQVIGKYEEEKVIENTFEHHFREEITNISHDLRTPLTSIKGYMQMLESEEISTEKKTEYYEVVNKRIDVLVQMLDEMFTYARILSDEYTLDHEQINVTNILSEVLSMYYYDFLKKDNPPNIELPVTPVYIYGHSEALKRVFQNLIKNYLDHGKEILSVELIDEEQEIMIYFKNYAPNISLKNIDKLFTRAYRTDESRTKKSTGLGLPIAKSLVEKMDGQVIGKIEEHYLVLELRFEKY